jgi:hypothetical protein
LWIADYQMTASGNHSDQLRFSLVLGLAFAAGAGFFAWQGASRTSGLLSLAGGVVLGIGALCPALLHPLGRAWVSTGRNFESIREEIADGIILASRSVFRTLLTCLSRKVQ